MDRPRLDLVADPAGARDLVLLAHGGQEFSTADPHDRRAPLLRMWPFARAAVQVAPGAAVGLLRYRYRGWNDPAADPLADLRAVLDRVPYSRIVLIGHSMGGRAVLRSADHPGVHAVLALAPWLPESDPLVEVPGRDVVLAHGAEDRITDPARTSRHANKLRASGAVVADLRAGGETHALLRRHGDWDELVRHFAVRSLGGSRGEDGGNSAGLAGLLDTNPSRPTDPLPAWSRARGTARGIASVASARLRLPVRRRL